MGTAVESVPLQSILQGKRESVGEAEEAEEAGEAGEAGEKEDAGTRGHGTVTRGKNKPTLRERLRRTTFKL
ncbi:MAG: hypothetical protein BRC51_03755 [Cyanobacteria bacterium SW_12_48_29]|jgi:hypothetical protein|nr:MAG: hypothetical protein BRC35_03750 [Cyanobacteria bacterium QH_10_48_56]PSO70358.1 MAG: hypothetical protein BRC37_15725 [Cyanobacteria bacterium QH_3_48_40]PSO84641.1 MAG: hypothetical protein BRC45_05335 [Cyanobacteria bacterium QS_5_48_63]PSO93523.1 MAG: hypothetical protein BRC46_06260 [Cyanobacteria bacterium QS_6_48_18]PSP06411.1 MAG: hypothetical protein BRC51_03755 [Cyanobacteria bacterium SW_12_48_29]PSP10629.1 MAG: hypothetical protein BRC50_14240 [Cyanobacteria bacterium SW_11